MVDVLRSKVVPAGYDLAPHGYLCVATAVCRSARSGEYVVAHLGSGSFFRTDRLGAATARALINGRVGAEAMQLAESIDAGAGERARRLICLLGSTGAMNVIQPRRRRIRWASIGLGLALGSMAPMVRIAPARLLAWTFKLWFSTPIAWHVWRCSRFRIELNLRASGYGDRSRRWLAQVGRRCAVEPSRNYLFNYVSVAIPSRRLERLVDRLFEADSLRELAVRLKESGPVVGVFLHGPLCVALPNALRNRGQEVVRVIVPRTHGVNVSASSGRLRDFFGESAEMTVEENDPNASGALLRHLKAGRNVYVALDRLAEGRTAKIEILGHWLARNDAPAWLAVHSRRPVMLWTTHSTRRGVVVTASPLIHPDPTLPLERRVATVSERLYAHAEAAIREHPEAWTCWTYPNLIPDNAA